MIIKGREFSISKFLCLVLYHCFAKYLPSEYLGRNVRYFICKHLFKKCGKNVNIERYANFVSGLDIEIGDNSGLGINCCIPSNTIIGNDVMMGPNCYILPHNHAFDRTDIPMCKQGFTEKRQTIIYG